jgi:hypothetical protein
MLWFPVKVEQRSLVLLMPPFDDSIAPGCVGDSRRACGLVEVDRPAVSLMLTRVRDENRTTISQPLSADELMSLFMFGSDRRQQTARGSLPKKRPFFSKKFKNFFKNFQ